MDLERYTQRNVLELASTSQLHKMELLIKEFIFVNTLTSIFRTNDGYCPCSFKK